MQRTTVAITLAVTASAAACSIPEKTLVAASADRFACLGQALPSTAIDPVTIRGTLTDPFHGHPVAGAAVEGFIVGTPSAIFTTTSDASGGFSREQGFGGMPRSAYLRASSNGYAPSYYYPAVPITGDIDLPIQMLMPADIATIAMIAGIDALDPTKVDLLVSVIDCNGNAVEGATVSTNPPGTVRYFAAATPSPTAIATDALTGSAMIANIPVSNTTINATVNGKTLRSHTFDGVAGALMQIDIQP
jgi:hypothetical protein